MRTGNKDALRNDTVGPGRGCLWAVVILIVLALVTAGIVAYHVLNSWKGPNF